MKFLNVLPCIGRIISKTNLTLTFNISKEEICESVKLKRGKLFNKITTDQALLQNQSGHKRGEQHCSCEANKKSSASRVFFIPVQFQCPYMDISMSVSSPFSHLMSITCSAAMSTLTISSSVRPHKLCLRAMCRRIAFVPVSFTLKSTASNMLLI